MSRCASLFFGQKPLSDALIMNPADWIICSSAIVWMSKCCLHTQGAINQRRNVLYFPSQIYATSSSKMSKDFCPPHRRPLLSVHTDKQPTGRSNQTRNDLLLLSGVPFSRVSTSVGCPARPHSGVCVLQLSRSDQTALPMSRTATAAPEMRRALTSQLLLTGSYFISCFPIQRRTCLFAHHFQGFKNRQF